MQGFTGKVHSVLVKMIGKHYTEGNHNKITGKIFNCYVVTDRRSVLPFCPNRTEQVNQSSVSRTETEQNRTCKKRIKT